MKADTPNAATGRDSLIAGTGPAWRRRAPGAAAGPAAADAAAAVTGLYQGHAVGLIRLALVMVGDRPAAEDIVQDAFTGLYRRWAHLGNSDTLITPDGRLIVIGTSPASDRPGTTGLAIAEFPARPGADADPARPVRTLDPVTAGGQLVLFRGVLRSNADGSVLIATGFRRLDGNPVIGVVTKSGFRPLPGSMAGVFQIAF